MAILFFDSTENTLAISVDSELHLKGHFLNCQNLRKYILWILHLTNFGLSCSSTLSPFTHFDSSPNQKNPSHPTYHHTLTVLKHYFTQILQNQTSWCPKSTSQDMHNDKYHLIVLSVYPYLHINSMYPTYVCLYLCPLQLVQYRP